MPLQAALVAAAEAAQVLRAPYIVRGCTGPHTRLFQVKIDAAQKGVVLTEVDHRDGVASVCEWARPDLDGQ